MYHLSRENKCTDQLRSNCEADPCLCFRLLGKNPVFSWRGSFIIFIQSGMNPVEHICTAECVFICGSVLLLKNSDKEF